MAEDITNVQYDQSNYTETVPLFQYDQGQTLHLNGFNGFARPIEVHVSNSKYGTASVFSCEGDDVLIPDSYFRTGRDIYVWLYLKDVEPFTDDEGNEQFQVVGRTVYRIFVPIKRRAGISGLSPTEKEADAFSKLVDVVGDISDKVNALAALFEDGVIILEGMNARERNEWDNNGHI